MLPQHCRFDQRRGRVECGANRSHSRVRTTGTGGDNVQAPPDAGSWASGHEMAPMGVVEDEAESRFEFRALRVVGLGCCCCCCYDDVENFHCGPGRRGPVGGSPRRCLRSARVVEGGDVGQPIDGELKWPRR